MAIGPQADRLVAGRYRLVARLGAGAMGTVWRAFDEMLQTEAALKEIEFAGGIDEVERADRVERALREARHAAKLRGHPNVVTVLDVVVEHGLPWIVMELVPSISLFERVRESGPLPVVEVARIGLALLDALTAAHALRILHRDVKPSNVLIGPGGRVVLTDFGIATHDTDPTLTVTGLLGTPMYMSPERLNGEPATPEADLFGLGATLYYAVEGRPAFERDTFGAMLAAILLHPPKPPERAGALTDVLVGLLEKEPSRRLDAVTARRMLVEASTGAGPTAADGAFPVVRAPGLGWQQRAAPQPAPALQPLPVPAVLPPGEHEAATALIGDDLPPDLVADAPVSPTAAALPVSPAPAALPAQAPAQAIDRSIDRSIDLAPPTGLVAESDEGAVVLRWSPAPGAVSYRVVRVTRDPSAPDGRRQRGLGITAACELSDGGVARGETVWHEVRSIGADGKRSAPASTAPRRVGAGVSALRAGMDGDCVALTWTPDPEYDEVVVERRFDETSPISGAMRRVTASGGHFTDTDVRPDAVYRYVVHVAGAREEGDAAQVVVRVTPRPRPVMDLEIDTSRGVTTLRWTSVPGAAVRVYATESSSVPGLAGTSPFGAADHEVATPSLDGRARLVGESRRGRLTDHEPSGDTVYTPVSLAGDRAVLGRAVHHTS